MEPLNVAFMRDTPLEMQRIYLKMLRDAGPQKRVALCLHYSALVRQMAIAAIRRAHPEYAETDIRREYLREILSPEEFRRFYPKASSCTQS